jgi:hypothetical protein
MKAGAPVLFPTFRKCGSYSVVLILTLFSKKLSIPGQENWLMSVILPTQEVEIRMIWVSQPRQKVSKTTFQSIS